MPNRDISAVEFLENLTVPPYSRGHNVDPTEASYTPNHISSALGKMNIPEADHAQTIEQLVGEGILTRSQEKGIFYSITSDAVIKYLQQKHQKP